jgi:hypothetical protein
MLGSTSGRVRSLARTQEGRRQRGYGPVQQPHVSHRDPLPRDLCGRYQDDRADRLSSASKPATTGQTDPSQFPHVNLVDVDSGDLQTTLACPRDGTAVDGGGFRDGRAGSRQCLRYPASRQDGPGHSGAGPRTRGCQGGHYLTESIGFKTAIASGLRAIHGEWPIP